MDDLDEKIKRAMEMIHSHPGSSSGGPESSLSNANDGSKSVHRDSDTEEDNDTEEDLDDAQIEDNSKNTAVDDATSAKEESFMSKMIHGVTHTVEDMLGIEDQSDNKVAPTTTSNAKIDDGKLLLPLTNSEKHSTANTASESSFDDVAASAIQTQETQKDEEEFTPSITADLLEGSGSTANLLATTLEQSEAPNEVVKHQQVLDLHKDKLNALEEADAIEHITWDYYEQQDADALRKKEHLESRNYYEHLEHTDPLSLERVLSNVESERISFNSTFRHRHVSPPKRGYNNGNHEGSGEAKNGEQTEYDKKYKLASNFGLVKKSAFENDDNDHRRVMLRKSIGHSLGKEILSRIKKEPEQAAWSLLTAAMQKHSTDLLKSKRQGYRHLVGSKIEDEPGGLQIAVRIRPPTKAEIQNRTERILSSYLDKTDNSEGPGTQNLVMLHSTSLNGVRVDQVAQALRARASIPREVATCFKFDYLLWSKLASEDTANKGPGTTSQRDMFNLVGTTLVENALSGISSCTFAHGPKDSGKTHTMFGDMSSHMADEAGLIPRVFSSIVERVEACHNKDTKCTLSIIEIYNEKVADLLHFTQPDHHKHIVQHRKGELHTLMDKTHAISNRKLINSHDLKVREHPVLGPYVDGSRKVTVNSTQDVMVLLREALLRRFDDNWLNRDSHLRRVHATLLATLEITPKVIATLSDDEPYDRNQAHAIRVNMVELPASEEEPVDTWRTSVLSGDQAQKINKKVFKPADIDMSGRLKKNNRSDANVFKEAAMAPNTAHNHYRTATLYKKDAKAVRKDLAHLNYILHSLERGADMRTLPFKDSLLTYLLRIALTSPNSKVIMLTTLSPASSSYAETLTCLKYSERLWQVKSRKHNFIHGDMDDSVSVVTHNTDMLSTSSMSVSKRYRKHKVLGDKNAPPIQQPQWQKYLKSNPKYTVASTNTSRKSNIKNNNQRSRSAPPRKRVEKDRSDSMLSSPGGSVEFNGVFFNKHTSFGHATDDPRGGSDLDAMRSERKAITSEINAFRSNHLLQAQETARAELMKGDTDDFQPSDANSAEDLRHALERSSAEVKRLQAIVDGSGNRTSNGSRMELIDVLKDLQVRLNHLEHHNSGGIFSAFAPNEGDSPAVGQEIQSKLAAALDAVVANNQQPTSVDTESRSEVESLKKTVSELSDLDAMKDKLLNDMRIENEKLEAQLMKARQKEVALEGELEVSIILRHRIHIYHHVTTALTYNSVLSISIFVSIVNGLSSSRRCQQPRTFRPRLQYHQYFSAFSAQHSHF